MRRHAHVFEGGEGALRQVRLRNVLGNVHAEADGVDSVFGEEHFEQVGDGRVYIRAGLPRGDAANQVLAGAVRGNREGAGVRHRHGECGDQHDQGGLDSLGDGQHRLFEALPLQVRFGAGEQQERLVEAVFYGVELQLRVLRLFEVVFFVADVGAAGTVVVQLVAVELDDFNVFEFAEQHLSELACGGSCVLRAGEGNDEG